MKRAYIDIPEGQIHYRTEGSGEPLLLLHQVRFSSDEYREMIPILAKKYKVIAMDTMGFGYSDPAPEGYLVEDYARTVISFLDALGIDKISVLGHHMGASIGIELAAMYPERIDKLIASGVVLYTQEQVDANLDDPRFKPMVVTKDGSFLIKEWHDIWIISSKNASLDTAYRRFLNRMLAGPGYHYNAVFVYKDAPKMRMIQCPVLITCGTEDILFPKMEQAHGLIKRSRVQPVEGGSVLMMIERAEDVANMVLDFLENPGA